MGIFKFFFKLMPYDVFLGVGKGDSLGIKILDLLINHLVHGVCRSASPFLKVRVKCSNSLAFNIFPILVWPHKICGSERYFRMIIPIGKGPCFCFEMPCLKVFCNNGYGGMNTYASFGFSEPKLLFKQAFANIIQKVLF